MAAQATLPTIAMLPGMLPLLQPMPLQQAPPAQPQNDQLVTNLQNRVFALEMENQRLKAENEQLKKRAAPAEPAAAAPAAKKARGAAKEAAAPAQQLDDKAVAKLLKKWGSSVGKQAKKEKFYYDSYSTDVVVEESLLPDFFKQIFSNAGTLIQPTPQNKPHSQVTIRRLSSFEAIQQLFGAGNISNSIDVNLWRRGGAANIVVNRGWFGMGGGARFQKAQKQGTGSANISELEIQYNKSSMALKLVFKCTLGRSGGCSWDVDYDVDY